jgi:hypothetical protein
MVVKLCTFLISALNCPPFLVLIREVCVYTRILFSYCIFDIFVCWNSDGLRAGWPGFDSRQGKRSFLFSAASRQTLGPTQLLVQWVLRAIYSGVKSPGREADHFLPSSAESRMVELYLHSPTCLHGVVDN